MLDTIIERKRKEVAERKSLYPTKRLEQSLYFEGRPVSLAEYLRRDDLLGVIAEIKRRSPSAGEINPFIDVEEVSIGYMQAGASALSVLTDGPGFGGALDDLSTARSFNYCPILRKDFVIDEYQVIEAKSAGADAVLLIAAVLGGRQIRGLANLAKSLGMDVLVEVHARAELEGLPVDTIDCVGVNSRNLDTFEVDLETALGMVDELPSELVKVAESGIRGPDDLLELSRAGYDGFLIGSLFMDSARPHEACKAFIAAAERALGES